MQQRKRTEAAITAAENKWKGAPPHIKVMAQAYMGPMLEALAEINAELAAIGGQSRLNSEGGGNG